MKLMNELDKAYELAEKAQSLKTKIWLEDIIFSFHWWLGICLTVIPWIIWILLSKRESRNRLLFTAFLIILISSFFDFLVFN